MKGGVSDYASWYGCLNSAKGVAKLSEKARIFNQWLASLNSRTFEIHALENVKDIKDPRLIEVLKDENSSVRRSVVNAVGEIKDPAAVPALLDALKDKNSGVRWSAVEALNELGVSEP